MRKTFTSLTLLAVLLTVSVMGPAGRAAATPGPQVPDAYARGTWRSFSAMASDTGLPADNLCRAGDGSWVSSRYTSPTNIGAYIWSTLAAADMGIIGNGEANSRLSQTMATLGRMERSHGFYYNWYYPETGGKISVWPVDGSPVRPFLSTVDNAWLATSLIMLRNARPAFAPQAGAILSGMNFGFFYDAFRPDDPFAHPGQMYGGYWTDTNEYTGFHYGLLNTEPRIASYIGIAMGDIPAEHYYRMFRTLPANYDWQEQIPTGPERTYLGVPVFEGHYTYDDQQFVPSWGGSMFEALMVPLFVPEARWAPDSWGKNHPLYVESQIEHGMKEAGYGYWGFSPSNKPEGGYREYGVDAIGSNPDGYTSNNDRTVVDRFSPPPPPSAYTNGVVTPHASFLALQFAPRQSLANLKALAENFDAFGQYGFYDSVNVDTGQVSGCVLALDQGMIMAAIANAVDNGSMQRYFTQGTVEARIRPLIAPEQFTAGRNS